MSIKKKSEELLRLVHSNHTWQDFDGKRRASLTFLRMVWITFKGFSDDLITMRSASLTYITLVSIVPTLVFSFAVAKGIGATEKLIKIIQGGISDFPEGAKEGINNIINIVQNADYTAIGATGLIVAALTTIKLLGRIEHSFNDIWGVKEHRTMMRKFSDYISIVIMIPVLIVASASVTFTLSSGNFMVKMEELLGPLTGLVKWLMSFSGMFVIFFAFFLLYVWLPNTKVRIVPAFAGSVAAGLSWKLVLLIFVKSQAGLTQSNPVYGTFAALPLFLVWLYASWVVTLLGSEVAFAVQHWKTYEGDSYGKDMSFKTQVGLAVLIMKDSIEAFKTGARWSPDKFADKYMLLPKSVLTVVHLLDKKGLLERGADEELHFFPGRMTAEINAADVIEVVAGDESDVLRGLEEDEVPPVLSVKEKWSDFLAGLKTITFV